MIGLIVSNATSVIGTVGLLLYAKKTGIIKEVKPHLDEMIRQGIRYKGSFYRAVLKSVDEL